MLPFVYREFVEIQNGLRFEPLDQEMREITAAQSNERTSGRHWSLNNSKNVHS